MKPLYTIILFSLLLASASGISVPGSGIPADCSTGTTTILPCNDGDPCTANDTKTILDADGSVCVPCMGTPIDCPTAPQDTFDFMLFRPGVQYLYDNPEFRTTTGSPVLGMKLTGTDSAGYSEAYLSARYEGFGPCAPLIPSFAGRTVYQAARRTIMAMDSARTDLVVLENDAAVGVSWAATSSITARVDSIREESFWSLTDEVKYISFSSTTDGTPLALSIRISKNFGLLTGTYFSELATTDSPLTLLSLSQPEIGPQLPHLRDVTYIPIGTELNIHRIRGSDFEPNTTSLHRKQQITITNNSYDEVNGKVRIDYLKNEYRYTRREPDYLFTEQEYEEGIQDSFVYNLADYAYLDAQPGEAVFPEFDWRGNRRSNPQMGILRARLFDSYGLGIGLPWLTRWDTLNRCGVPPQESGNYGYYFSNLGGPYFTAGYSSYFNNDLVGAFNEYLDSGESYTTNPLGEVRLGEPFGWQLFRPGVQYLYEKPDLAEAEYVGMKLNGLGEETVYESLRGEDTNCREQVPSFAGLRLRQQPEGTTLLFYADSLHLRTAAQIGDGWVANDTTLATVDSIVLETFLGVTDSIKYISFRQWLTGEQIGTSIRISKNYGLVTATYFYDLASNEVLPLVGLSNPEVGLQAPSFQSLTNFTPGDEYHTRVISSTLIEGSVRYQTAETQATVLDVERIGDSLVYVYIRKNELTYSGIFPEVNVTDSVYRENRLQTIVYDLRETPWMGGQASQLFADSGGDNNLIQVFANGCLGMSLLLDLHLERDEEGCYTWMSGLIGHNGIYRNRVAGPFERSVEGAYVIDRLVYFNNDLCSGGDPLDFSGLVDGVNDFRPDQRIRLFPNPASGRVTLDVPTDLGNVSFQIFSVDGRLAGQYPALPGTREISVAALPPGVYTVLLSNDGGPVGRRRVVVR